MTELKSLTYEQLQELLKQLSQPKYKADQVFSWLYRGVTSFDEMSDISKALREKLAECSVITVPQIERKLVSAVDGTVKYLWRLHDGEYVESVVMKYHHGNTICVSTQVGCRMGCAFCASTKNGLVRNLTAGEICDQVIFAEKDTGERISNIVLMGIGEPLDNFDNVMTFLKNINHEKGKNIGYRHISLSTCGLVDKIYELAKIDIPITLSISLHAPNDEKRKAIMPVARKWDVETLLKACRDYVKVTTRRISFEYTMIQGQNDSLDDARELAKRLRGCLCHVNLIPVNTIAERDFTRSRKDAIEAFRSELERLGITATVRRTLGADINASCGQLRNKANG